MGTWWGIVSTSRCVLEVLRQKQELEEALLRFTGGRRDGGRHQGFLHRRVSTTFKGVYRRVVESWQKERCRVWRDNDLCGRIQAGWEQGEFAFAKVRGKDIVATRGEKLRPWVRPWVGG